MPTDSTKKCMGIILGLAFAGIVSASDVQVIAIYQYCDQHTCNDTWSACDVEPTFDITTDGQFIAWCHDDATICQGELYGDVLHCDTQPTFERRIMRSGFELG